MNFDKFKVVDDFIPLSLQEEIKTKLLVGSTFPWFYTVDITYNSETSTQFKNPGFSYLFKRTDAVAPIISALGQVGATVASYPLNSILQARTFLQLPLSSEFMSTNIDLLHIDATIPHLVVLYYVIDSDGDTLLTELQHQPGQAEKIDQHVESHKIIARVTPKQGRAVLFDGSIYHTAEQPRQNMRCVINIDVA